MTMGAKYDTNMTTKQIAEAIRADLRAAVKAGELPKARYTVRQSVSTLHASITVTVARLPFLIHSTDWVAEVATATFGVPSGTDYRYSAEARRVRGTIFEIVEAYNRDDSRPEYDVFDCCFYSHVTFRDEAIERRALEAAYESGARTAERLGQPRAAGGVAALLLERAKAANTDTARDAAKAAFLAAEPDEQIAADAIGA